MKIMFLVNLFLHVLRMMIVYWYIFLPAILLRVCYIYSDHRKIVKRREKNE